MKRRAPDPGGESLQRHGRRQPQTSCDFCRRRKLKCDRGQPCSSCTTRGLPCQGQPAQRRAEAAQSPDVLASDSILRRLHALEDAVFNSGKQNRGLPASFPDTPSSSTAEGECFQSDRTARILDETAVWNGSGLSVLSGTFEIGIAPPSCPVPSRPQSSGHHGFIWMMPREQAMALLQDYLDGVYPLVPVFHGATTRALIADFYDRLSRGVEIRPQTAAVILGIGAVGAYFWQPGSPQRSRFASAEEAVRASLVWSGWATDILMRMQGSDTTLEVVQGWVILAFISQNVDGCSKHSRFLHDCSLTAARALSLHLVDSPRSECNDDRVTREIKRRLWWHVTATDWILGFVGGPAEGTYSVHPRHMNVKIPRNLNDDDLATADDSTAFPPDVPTQMSCFLQRVRLGEIARAILDARPAGSPDVETMDYDCVSTLDRQFEDAFAALPVFFQTRGPFQINRLDALEVQRVVVLLGGLSRRARLHRPFLLKGPPVPDPRHRRSREICLGATRAAVDIATRVIEFSLGLDDAAGSARADRRRANGSTGRGLPAHRIGHLMNHLFMGCAVLAFYVSDAGRSPGSDAARREQANVVNSSEKDGGDDGDEKEEADRAAVRAELAHACRLVPLLGAESPVAAGLLRNFVDLLRRYRIRDVDGTDMTDRFETVHHAGKKGDSVAGTDAGLHGQPQALPSEKMPTTSGEAVGGPVDGTLPTVMGFELDGLWDDLVMGSSEDYTQLLADLDYHFWVA